MRLLELVEIGDRKPSQFLRHLRGLAGTCVSESLLRTLWLGRLSANVQAILATQMETPLDKVAELADAITETIPSRPMVADATLSRSAAQSSPVDPVTKRMMQLLITLQSQTELMQGQIAELRASRGDQQPGRQFQRRRNNSRRRFNSRGQSPASGVGTGADLCVFPRKLIHGLCTSSEYELSAANGSPIATNGTKTLTLNLGLRRDLTWRFVVADVSRPIIGADFLAHFGLLVDIRNQRLIDQTMTLTSREAPVQDNTPSIKQVQGETVFHGLLRRFPEITKPSGTPVEVNHGTCHFIRTTPGPSVVCKPRGLAPDRRWYVLFPFMTFGLRNAAQTFQRFIDEVLRGLDFCYAYIDDILVVSDSEKEHLEYLEILFKRLKQFGIVVNPGKCVFGQATVKFLGYTVSEADTSLCAEKVQAILNFPEPVTAKQLRRFLGMVNFYRRFIPRAAQTQAPLNNLLVGNTKGSQQVQWSVKARAAFSQCREDLSQATLLAHPKPNATVALTCDASNTMVGAALHQRIGDEWKPLSFFSTKLSPAEQNYSAFDREILAIYQSIKHFRRLLEGRDNVAADALSRIEAVEEKVNFDALVASQSNDPELRRDAVKGILEPPYDGPYQVLGRTIIINIDNKRSTVSLDRVKPASYSPDMAAVDFFLFPRNKSALKGMDFGTIDAVQTAVTKALYGVPIKIFQDAYNTSVPLSETVERFFADIKEGLANVTLLVRPILNAPVSIAVDASDYAVGALLQQFINNMWQPLAFYTKVLSAAQRKCSAYDRELFAIYTTVKRFRYLVEVRNFIIYIDHKPLIFAFRQKLDKCSSRQFRYLDYISQFSTDIRHIKGVANNVADALSRVETVFSPLDYKAFEQAQRQDLEMKQMLETETCIPQLKKVHFPDIDVFLHCDVSSESIRPFIPSPLRRTVFESFHGYSHSGVHATQKLLTDRFVWSAINKDCREWAKHCISCQRAKVTEHVRSSISDFKNSGTFDHVAY
ncbi:uncharacterized protein LOC143264774 [Megachile rotundata]|uniref:uncharacterized protein LOC143264774 n=1 Tax=Megachile rotundata TaxID=143995 RepID=UPI003FD13D86